MLQQDSIDRLLTMSAFEAAHIIRTFRRRNPGLSNEVLVETARAVNINFFPHDYSAGAALEECIPNNLGVDQEIFFTSAIDTIIKEHQPFWVRLVPSGRNIVCAALDENGRQCFRSSGLLGTSERAIVWWDRIATAVRMAQDADRLAQGRIGERLSFERETAYLKAQGIDKTPIWVALDDNSLGYDILSYRQHGNRIVNRLIEVKTTYSKPPRLILTRNEWKSADRFGDAFEYHIWALPEEQLVIKTVEGIRPHIPSNIGFGEWLDVEIVLPNETLNGRNAVKGLSVFELDDRSVGDVTYRRNRYEVIQRALVSLLETVRHWNQVATSNGASIPPYAAFETHLTNMVDWGERKLKDQRALSITVTGMSVGSLGLQRAALEYAAAKAEQDAIEKSKGVPPAVADSLLDQARTYMAEAMKIEHPAHPVLKELLHDLGGPRASVAAPSHEWDVFISHASEDKDVIARPLADALHAEGLKIWFDELTLKLGDSLRQAIDRGLARSQYGIVILSPAFFAKDWPQRELDGLGAREVDGAKVILPVWHGVDRATVASYSPMLAGRLAASSSSGVPRIVKEVLKVLRP